MPTSAAAPARHDAGRSGDVVGGFVDPLEPDLAPVVIDPASTEQVEVAGADDAFEDDAVGLDVDHLAVLLLDQASHAAAYARSPAAEAGHLVIETQAAVAIVAIERGDDL